MITSTTNTVPGRCHLAPLLLVLTVIIFALLSVISPRSADAQKKKSTPPAATAKPPKNDGGERASDGSKVYSFTGLDIDGRLKTPQLLYFLSRVRSEFDSVTPTHRSFVPELEKSPEGM